MAHHEGNSRGATTIENSPVTNTPRRAIQPAKPNIALPVADQTNRGNGARSTLNSTKPLPRAANGQSSRGQAEAKQTPTSRMPAPDSDADSAVQSLNEIAKSAVDVSADIPTNFKKLDKALKLDAELYTSLRDEAYRRLILNAIYSARAHQKCDAKAMHKPCNYTLDAMEANANLMKSFLDRWYLPSGKLLGDATGPELKELGMTELSRAKGIERPARLYLELADLCGDSTVRAAVGEKAEEIWRRIEAN